MIRDKLFPSRPRKFVGLLAVLAILAMACPVPVAANGTVVSIPNANADFCDTDTVPIVISNVISLAGATITLQYDSSVVEVTSVVGADLGAVTPGINNPAGETTISWIDMSGLGQTGTFDFADITLHAVGSADETSALTLVVDEMINNDLEPIPHSIVNGEFKVTGVAVVEYTLTLSSTEGGEVTRPGEGPFTYDEGTRVNLRATPDACYEFDEWTGEVADVADVHDSSTTVTMNGDYEIVAEFVPMPPHLVVNKSVSPSTIGQKGSGLKPEEARVTLTVSGACDPHEYLTDIVVTDVLQSYINLEDDFTIEPDIETADGITTLVWDVGELDTTGEWTVSFDISSDKCGRVLVDVVDDSKVTYNVGEDSEEALFPETYLNVRCPREVAVGVLPPEPAKIGAAYLYISPEQIVPSQWVEISANIYNRGGTKATHTVSLYINGYLAQSQTVGVSPGGTELVVFRVRADSEFLGGIYTGPGEYIANVEGMEGQFFVLAPAAAAPAGIAGPLGTGGIIAIVVVVIVLIVGLVFGLKRE